MNSLDNIQVDTLVNFFSMYCEELADVLESVTGYEMAVDIDNITELVYQDFLNKHKKLIGLKVVVENLFDFYFLVDIKLAAIVVDFVVGGDGKDVKDEDFGDLKFGIIKEVFEEFNKRFSEMFNSIFTNKYSLKFNEVEIISDLSIFSKDNFILIPLNVKVYEDLYPIYFVFTRLNAVSLANSLISINRGTPIEQETISTKAEEVDQTTKEEVKSVQKEAKPVEVKKEVHTDKQQTYSDLTHRDIPTSFVNKEVEVSKPQFQEITSTEHTPFSNQLELLLDVKVKLSAVIGSKEVTFKDLIDMGEGSVIELDSLVGEPIKIYANNKVVATGEVVVIEDKFGIRIKSIVSKKNRLENITK